MSNLPPMSGRAFRNYFMIDDEPTFERAIPRDGQRRKRFDDDPYERCDFEEDGDDDGE